jgi:methyltransferase-like protein/2-polyprenyl-3-methyl-5-hydroxy-6-metoxy-1,4-benzoquinol methylase
MSGTGTTSYDEIPYPGHAYSWTHPDHLATMAHIFGFDPVPPDHGRVLEIGCGDGANLIPMAYTLPQSEFLGIDLAGRPIAEGQASILRLGLKNITLRQMDLRDFSEREGAFDYIIAHGFYSWVPTEIRDRLLQVCSTVLSPSGIAFVSYNTYPGYYVRQMLREIMLFHVHEAPNRKTKVEQAVALAHLLADALAKTDESTLFLKNEWERTYQRHPGHLCHEDLSEINQPVYFHEFMEHATRYGLQYLAESEPFMMFDAGLPKPVRESLAEIEDNRLLTEQYLDFIRCRRFRQTLLCHQGISLQYPLSSERIRHLRASTSASPLSASVDLNSTADATFCAANNATMTCDHPVAKAAMLSLIKAWPRSLAFHELVAAIQPWLEESSTERLALLVEQVLLAGFKLGVVELHSVEPHLSMAPGEQPIASPVARLQAEMGKLLTNLRHVSVCIPHEGQRRLIPLMDGTRNLAELAQELKMAQGEDANLDEFLEELSRLALLI